MLSATLTISACGAGADPGLDPANESDAPVIQITSEGGFAPVEMILNRGPRYTLTADRRLIYEGPTTMEFPGRLIPNYQVATISDQQMRLVLELVDEIGLPEIEREIDDTAASRVADATTEVVTYWDETGQHTYGVYALGIDLDEPEPPATEAFGRLMSLMGELVAGDAEPYVPEQVRIVAGPGFVHEDFEDIRDWPLPDEDLSDWETLPNGWLCKAFDPGVLSTFEDATQVTVWRWVPGDDPTLADAEFLDLLVRPLHPGEPDCPTN